MIVFGSISQAAILVHVFFSHSHFSEGPERTWKRVGKSALRLGVDADLDDCVELCMARCLAFKPFRVSGILLFKNGPNVVDQWVSEDIPNLLLLGVLLLPLASSSVTRSPSSALLSPFLGEGSQTNIDSSKKLVPLF